MKEILTQYGLDQSLLQTVTEIVDSIDLAKSLALGKYGELPAKSGRENAIPIGDNSPATAASMLISDIVKTLQKSDPNILLKRHNWFSRYIGKATADQIDFFRSADTVDSLLAQVPASIDGMERAVEVIESAIEDNLRDIVHLKMHLCAGQAFIQRLPETQAGVLDTTSQRERFERRLTNLVAMLQNAEIHTRQLQLALANLIDLIDRLREVSGVLVPAWINHRMGLHLGAENDVKAVADAVKSHDALLDALSDLTNSTH